MADQKTTKTVDRQISLPTSKAVEIAWKNIRLRLSRSLVVTSGIVLAIAFLMYIFCSDVTIAAMRQWTSVAPATDEFVQTKAKAADLTIKVQSLADQLAGAALSLDAGATGSFDATKTFGRDFPQIQRELGSLPAAPDAMNKLLGARPDTVGVFRQWMDQTTQLRQAKTMINGPQELLSMMKSAGVATTPKEIENSRIQTKWLISLALMVAFAGILNAMLMSVTERFREIGTMKCLGALDSFIVKLFLIESFFQGGVGTILGVTMGLLLNVAGVTATYGSYAWKMFPYGQVAVSAAICLFVGLLLTVGGACYPAWHAARMHPIEAMRSDA